MDSLEIEGKEYISARRAAKEHGYVTDYIGQLIRGGKLIGKKVGRAWYVECDSLAAYVEGAGIVSEAAPQIVEPAIESKQSEDTPVRLTVGEAGTEKTQLVANSRTMQTSSTAQDTAPYELLTYVDENNGKEEEVFPVLSGRASYTEEMPRKEQSQEISSASYSGAHEPREELDEIHNHKAHNAVEEPQTPFQPKHHKAVGFHRTLIGTLAAVAGLVFLAGIGVASVMTTRVVTFDGASTAASLKAVTEVLELEIPRYFDK